MLYVVTAVHNRYAITENFVKQLNEQTYKDIKLVLVDDGSTDGTGEMVKNLMPDAEIIRGDGNLWWGGALHKAFKWVKKNASNEDFIMYMNDDTNFNPDFMETGMNLITHNPDCLITGCGYSTNTGEQLDGAVEFFPATGTYKLHKGNGESNCTSTRALIMSVPTMKKIGGFHPVLLPHYASDYEYTIRAARKGFEIKAFEEFNYRFDEKTTGNRNPKNATLKQIFSKRSVFNPIYRISYIFMVTPLKYLPHHLTSQIKRYIKK